MAKVVHLTTAHWAADPRIFDKECRALADAGHDVSLVVPHDRSEVVKGVRIIPVPHPHDRFDRFVRTAWRVYRAAARESAGVYQFHDPDLVPAALLLKVAGKVVIYDAHEDISRQGLSKDWIPAAARPAVARLAGMAEKAAARAFDGIVAATPTIAKRFPPHKTVIVSNFPRVEEFPASDTPHDDRFEIVMAGGISALRCAREILEAFRMLVDKGTAPRARLVFVGHCADAGLKHELADATQSLPFDLLDWQSLEYVKDLLSRAAVGLVFLHRRPGYVDSLPTKLFEYMAASIPIITTDFGPCSQVVLEYQCGLVVEPGDVPAAASAMEWLLTHPSEAAEMGRRGRSAAEERFSWESESKQLTSFYDRITAGGGDQP